MNAPGGRRVLVVEDDRAVAELLVEVLRHEGYDATVASDGLEGLVKLRGSPPDLAVLDIMMPDIDGVRVIEQLLEESDGALTPPVLVITGSPMGAMESRRLIGDANVFEKPFDPDVLIARIRALIGG